MGMDAGVGRRRLRRGEAGRHQSLLATERPARMGRDISPTSRGVTFSWIMDTRFALR